MDRLVLPGVGLMQMRVWMQLQDWSIETIKTKAGPVSIQRGTSPGFIDDIWSQSDGNELD